MIAAASIVLVFLAAALYSAKAKGEMAWTMLGAVAATIGTSVIFMSTSSMSFSAQLSARLVMWGILPQGFSRRQLKTAVALFFLRASREETIRFEVESCLSDNESDVVVDAIRHALPRALILLDCARLSARALEEILLAVLSHKELGSGRGLQEVDLTGCRNLGDDAGRMLGGSLLREATSLEKLCLVGCGLTQEGVSAMYPQEQLDNVSVLDITSMLRSSADQAPPGVPAPPALPLANENTSTSPPPLAAPLFRTASRADFCLKKLQLSSNMLAGAGRALAALVRVFPHLDQLSLEACSLSAEDIQQLGRALPRSKVAKLDLAENTLRSKGLLAVTGSLRLSHIQDLGLERNEIGMGDALYELKAVHDRRPFPQLRLSGNRLTTAQETAFMQTLRKTSSKTFGGSYCPPGCNCFEGRGEVM